MILLCLNDNIYPLLKVCTEGKKCLLYYVRKNDLETKSLAFENLVTKEKKIG